MSRMWPSRAEWAAFAEHAVRTACYPLERVPEGAEHYLTPEEYAERERLFVEVSTAARPILTREINRLAALPLDVSTGSRLSVLRNARLHIGRRARGEPEPRRGSALSAPDPTVLSTEVADLLRDLPGWDRLHQLETRYEHARQEAADQAVRDAVAREIARRNSDEGWAKELERRARIDGSFITTHAATTRKDQEDDRA